MALTVVTRSKKDSQEFQEMGWNVTNIPIKNISSSFLKVLYNDPEMSKERFINSLRFNEDEEHYESTGEKRTKTSVYFCTSTHEVLIEEQEVIEEPQILE